MTDLATRYGPWALVAGASEGIGASFCRRVAAEGVNVFLVARRPAPLEALATELRGSFGVETAVATIDLAAEGADRDLFEATAGREVGLLVYNAGADDRNVRFLDAPARDWSAMVRRNCMMPVLTAHHYMSAMMARGRGGVILVSSGAAWAGGFGLATYGATKAFDLVFGESLWAEYRDDGVDTLSLVAGPTDTPAFREALARHGAVPPDLADPDDVARAGLDHLGEGPTWSMGLEDGGGPFPLGALSRRQAVELMSAGTRAIFQQTLHTDEHRP
jgi:short-subunit dehydrogenase